MEPKKNGGNRNMMGILTILFWAFILTLAFNSLTSTLRHSSVVEVPYTTFYKWVEQGYIKAVNMENTEYTVTLKE